jgi:hypothetical protein
MRFTLKLAQSTQPGEIHPKFSTERQQFGSRGHFLEKKRPQRGIVKPKHAVE